MLAIKIVPLKKNSCTFCFFETKVVLVHLCILTVLVCSKDALQRCKSCIEMMANTLGLEGFSRIDVFVNVRNGEVTSLYSYKVNNVLTIVINPYSCILVLKVLLIEVNTVPGMTPSTVLIHQVIKPLYPLRQETIHTYVILRNFPWLAMLNRS